METEELDDSKKFTITDLKITRNILFDAIERIDRLLIRKDDSDELSDNIIKGFCSFYKITPVSLKLYKRSPYLVQRKRMLSYLLSEHTKMSQDQISSLFGYKNHTSVTHHIIEMRNQLSDKFYGDEETKKTYKQLLKHLKL
jgi:chromosomal replication initiation ATPase DnaA